MKFIKLTSFITVSIMFLGCASKHYEEALEKDTVSAYNNFLQEHGDSEYANQARQNRDALIALSQAKRINTISGYNDFLERYRTSKYRYIAERKKRDLETKQYISSLKMMIKNAPSAIRQVLIMKNYYDKTYKSAINNDTFLHQYYENTISCFKTKRDIVVIDIESDYKDLLIVDKRIDYVYAGKILKGDIVYKSGEYISTLHNYKDLKSIYTNHRKWLDEDGKIKEAFGSFKEFKKENKLINSDLFENKFYSSSAKKYFPSKFVKKNVGFEGELVDFIEENPLTSLAIGAGVAVMLSDNSSSVSSSSSSSSSNSYDLSEDPSMTRWEPHYCSSCGKSTKHKVYRHSQGSSQADYQCKVCGNSYGGSW